MDGNSEPKGPTYLEESSTMEHPSCLYMPSQPHGVARNFIFQCNVRDIVVKAFWVMFKSNHWLLELRS